MIKKDARSDRIDFDVDEFMTRLGVDCVEAYVSQKIDVPDKEPYLIYEGISTSYGANITLTARDSKLTVEIVLGAFKIQSLNHELSIRQNFTDATDNENIFFSSGNGFLIVSINHCTGFISPEGIEALVNNSLELVPKISALLSQHRDFTPFVEKSAEVLQ